MHELVKSESDVELIWRAFELRPEPAPTLDPKGDYLQRAWNTSVYPLAERLGVTMKLPPLQPRTRLAHEAAHWARSQARFDDYHDEIFRAFFERGEDIGEHRLLDRQSSVEALTLDKKTEKLFFDTQSGLLIRRTIFTETLLGLDPEEVDYEDYRKVDGAWLPFTVKDSYLDDNHYGTTRKLIEVRQNLPIDDAKFEMTAAK